MISHCHVNRFFEPWCGGCPPRCRGLARDRPSPYRAGDGSCFTVARGPVLRVAVGWRGTGPRPTGPETDPASPWRGGLSSALPWVGEGQALALRDRRQLTLHRGAGACPPRCRGLARDRPSPYRDGDESRFTVARKPGPASLDLKSVY